MLYCLAYDKQSLRLRLKQSLSQTTFMINRILGLFSHDIGIDLGTANTLVWVKDKGITIREPSVVARHKKTKEILAIGSSAKKMIGKTPAIIEAIRPLKDGVIADFDATASMLSYYIKKVHESGSAIPKIPRPKVIIGIPSGVTEVERRAVAEAAIASGAREAFLVEEPMAAAIGIGLPIEEPGGVFVVDIGGGTTEIALISLGGVVVGRSVRVAGDEMDEAIINYVRLKYSLLLGQPTAERVKIDIGSSDENTKDPPASPNAKHLRAGKFAVIRGRDLETGLPKSIKLTSVEVTEALSPILQEIVGAIKETLEESPPELVSDIMQKGSVITGGGSLLGGLNKLVEDYTKMPVYIADDPLTSVVRGTGKLLESPILLKRIRVTSGLK
jgi:rod shape-determining protein MreB and related proteins